MMSACTALQDKYGTPGVEMLPGGSAKERRNAAYAL
jgi:hypothetical protein